MYDCYQLLFWCDFVRGIIVIRCCEIFLMLGLNISLFDVVMGCSSCFVVISEFYLLVFLLFLLRLLVLLFFRFVFVFVKFSSIFCVN